MTTYINNVKQKCKTLVQLLNKYYNLKDNQFITLIEHNIKIEFLKSLPTIDQNILTYSSGIRIHIFESLTKKHISSIGVFSLKDKDYSYSFPSIFQNNPLDKIIYEIIKINEQDHQNNIKKDYFKIFRKKEEILNK